MKDIGHLDISTAYPLAKTLFRHWSGGWTCQKNEARCSGEKL